MLRNWFGHALAAASAAVIVAPAARAQAYGCEDAAVRVNTTSLPRVGAPQWNDWVTLTGCGARGATVIAAALRSDGVRTETELTRLDHLAGLLDGWFQPQLVSAYQSLLRAPDASHAVRLRAMWLLAGLYAPDVDVAGPLQGFMSARCESYDRKTALRDAPETLPAEAYDQARDAIAVVAEDRYAPEYVRSTARCWEGVLGDALEHGNAVEDNRAAQTVVVSNPTVVVQRPVRVVYDCDSRFVFYNDVGYDLAVRYDGFGSAGVLRVGHGGPFVWAAARFGPVRFWVGESEVFYTDAVYRSCYGYGHRLIVGAPIYPWYGWHAGLGLYLAPRFVVQPRIYVPFGYVVRPPRWTRPIVIHHPRGGRDDWDRRGYGYYDNRGDRGRGVRPGTVGGGGRRPIAGAPGGNPGGRPVGEPRGGGVPRGWPVGTPRNDIPRSGPVGEPRGGGPRNGPAGEPGGNGPRTGEPRGGGSRVAPWVNRAPEARPVPRAPEGGARFAVPKGGGDRSARPGGGDRSGDRGAERSAPARGKPGGAHSRNR